MSEISQKLYTVRLHIKEALTNYEALCLAESFADSALSMSVTASDSATTSTKNYCSWVLECIMPYLPKTDEIISKIYLQAVAYNIQHIEILTQDIEIKEISTDINWLEETYQGFKPFCIGSFFIYGSNDHRDIKVAEGQIGLQIDAVTAFGSGDHETTKGCLQAMLDLKGKGVCPWNILDMGTGSGILAIAAWKLWKSPILAIDNDEESIKLATRHVQINGITLGKSAITCEYGNGFNAPIISKKKPYELILANILAAPVIEMAPALVGVLDDNGYVVLSGMLKEQSNLVASAYEGEGLTLKKSYNIGNWSTIVLQKRNL